MVDLHTHTDASDGTDTPEELIRKAVSMGLEALAITDHDTLHGYELALPVARREGLELVCGIEISTKQRGKTVHLLGYFLRAEPAVAFTMWLNELQEKRRDRNARLVGRLRQLGIDITLEEVHALGKHMAGRPHFARILVRKGYVKTSQEAFDRYIAEEGKAYVEREEVPLAEAIRRVSEAGGLAVMAHPVRLNRRDPMEEEDWIREAVEAGMGGIEVQHSDHGAGERQRYAALAAKYGLGVTGGSDYHGGNKMGVALGTGRSNVNVPRDWLEALRG
jgi:3',5'-nucleoside bisphosphate phosphatase